MIKLLAAAVIIAVLGVTVNRLNSSSTGSSDPVGAQQQVDSARQDIDEAINLETQRSTELNTVGEP
jgi:hypothetical protein